MEYEEIIKQLLIYQKLIPPPGGDGIKNIICSISENL